MNNNAGFWVSLALAAIISGVSCWFGAKAYYTSSKPVTDTASAVITPPTTVVVAGPTKYVPWEKIVKDTVYLHPSDPLPLYPALDTAIILAVEVRPDSMPPDTAYTVAYTNIVYNHALNQFRFSQTIDPLHVRIPVRREQFIEFITREPLLWCEPSMLIGDYSKGVGVRVGLMRYSLGYTRIWNTYVPNDNEGVWQAGVRFNIF